MSEQLVSGRQIYIRDCETEFRIGQMHMQFGLLYPSTCKSWRLFHVIPSVVRKKNEGGVLMSSRASALRWCLTLNKVRSTDVWGGDLKMPQAACLISGLMRDTDILKLSRSLFFGSRDPNCNTKHSIKNEKNDWGETTRCFW